MADTKPTGVFSEVERAAMRQRAKELAAEAKSVKTREEGEQSILEAIAKMSEPDKSKAQRINQLVKDTAPDLMPKTWYGFPSYANKEGKIVCFFQPGEKFGYRYATLGFQEDAHLDDGEMWPVAYAINKLTPVEEKQIVELLKKAIS